MKNIILYSILFVLLSACATKQIPHTYCQIYKPIYLTEPEFKSLTDTSLLTITKNNEVYDEICKK